MKTGNFTPEELANIKATCEIYKAKGIDWPLMVRIYPAEGADQQAWKERMLEALRLLGMLGPATPN